MEKKRKIFIVLVILYFMILAAEITFGHLFIKDAMDKYNLKNENDISVSEVYRNYYIIYGIIAFFLIILSCFYMQRLNKFLNGMKSFHVFLTTYR